MTPKTAKQEQTQNEKLSRTASFKEGGIPSLLNENKNEIPKLANENERL